MRRATAWLAAGLLLAAPAACSDDDGDDPSAGPTTEAPPGTPAHGPTSSTTLATGALEIEAPAGFTPIPLPSAGFGLAVPAGWEATVLTEDALDQLEAFDVSPGFVDAARNAARAGAVVYAAGVDAEGRVADLKVTRIPMGTAPDAAAVEEAARQAQAAIPGGAELELRPGGARPEARLRFQTSDGAVSAAGTQWLIGGPDSIWSLIVTSEDATTHDQLADQLAATLTFA